MIQPIKTKEDLKDIVNSIRYKSSINLKERHFMQYYVEAIVKVLWPHISDTIEAAEKKNFSAGLDEAIELCRMYEKSFRDIPGNQWGLNNILERLREAAEMKAKLPKRGLVFEPVKNSDGKVILIRKNDRALIATQDEFPDFALVLIKKADWKNLFAWLESRAPRETKRIQKQVQDRSIAQLEFCLYELVHILHKKQALQRKVDAGKCEKKAAEFKEKKVRDGIWAQIGGDKNSYYCGLLKAAEAIESTENE